MTTIELYNLGVGGIYKDIPPHLLPPEVWSDGNNMRMLDGYPTRSLGYTQIFGTPTVAPGFVMAVPAAADDVFWLYASKVAVYGYHSSTHTDITRAGGGTPYTAAEYRDWNGCILGGVPVLNNGADVPQYWSALSLATDLAALPNWDSNLRAKVIRNFGPYLVALNLTDTGTALPHAVAWSAAADPGSVPASWDDADPTVDAGRTHLTDIEGGEIRDGKLLGSQLVIYKEQSTHSMRYVGGQNIFSFDKLFDVGLLAARCAALVNGGRQHIAVGSDDIFVHSGGAEISYPISKRDRRYFYADLDTTHYANMFAMDNHIFHEAWICYPSTGMTYPNKKLVWNYQNDTVHFDDFSGLSADWGKYPDAVETTWSTITGSWDAQANPWATGLGRRRMVVGDPNNTKIWGQDSGYAFGATSGTLSMLQRTGLAIVSRDRQGNPKADFKSRKLGKRIWPKISGDATVSVRMGAQEEINGSITWAAPQTYSSSQKYLDFTVNGRLLAVEFTSLSDAEWRLEGYDLEVELLGVH